MTSEALAQRSWSVFAGAGVAVVTVVVLMVVVVVVVIIVVALMEVAVVLAAAAVKTPVTTNRQARVRRKVPEASLVRLGARTCLSCAPPCRSEYGPVGPVVHAAGPEGSCAVAPRGARPAASASAPSLQVRLAARRRGCRRLDSGAGAVSRLGQRSGHLARDSTASRPSSPPP